jgi:hypothetical protein
MRVNGFHIGRIIIVAALELCVPAAISMAGSRNQRVTAIANDYFGSLSEVLVDGHRSIGGIAVAVTDPCNTFCEIAASQHCGIREVDTCQACCQIDQGNAQCRCESCGFLCERAVCECRN